jgi:hypothetical protein
MPPTACFLAVGGVCCLLECLLNYPGMIANYGEIMAKLWRNDLELSRNYLGIISKLSSNYGQIMRESLRIPKNSSESSRNHPGIIGELSPNYQRIIPESSANYGEITAECSLCVLERPGDSFFEADLRLVNLQHLRGVAYSVFHSAWLAWVLLNGGQVSLRQHDHLCELDE